MKLCFGHLYPFFFWALSVRFDLETQPTDLGLLVYVLHAGKLLELPGKPLISTHA